MISVAARGETSILNWDNAVEVTTLAGGVATRLRTSLTSKHPARQMQTYLLCVAPTTPECQLWLPALAAIAVQTRGELVVSIPTHETKLLPFTV